MSYCVNCGVELASTEKSCPLCRVTVCNPVSPWKDPESYPYPRPRPSHEYEKALLRELIIPISLLVLIPTFITVACDLLTGHGITWSAFVLASVAIMYVFLLPPLLMKKHRPFFFILLDTCAICAFLFVVEYNVGGHWFFPFALPITAIACVVILMLTALFRHLRLPKPTKAALVFFALALFALCAELLINFVLRGFQTISWSLFIIIPAVLLGAICLIVGRNRRLKEEMRKRFFI